MSNEIGYKKRGNVVIPYFKNLKALSLDEDTPICSLQELVDLLGEERALNLYAHVKARIKGA